MAARIVLLFLMVVGVTMAADRFTVDQYRGAFTDWMSTHNKFYLSSEFAAAFDAFRNNMDFCDAFNARNASFKVGLNLFSDMNVDQFRSLLLNPISHPTSRSVVEGPEFTGEGMNVPRAATVDWRTKGAVSAIKNQGQCGSCWTFSAAGAIESLNVISGGSLVQLSEQNLLDCETASSHGCDGGSYMAAFNWVAKNGGIDTMASYPYTGVNKTCAFNAANVGATITGYSRVTANDESALESAVYKQPVSVGIRADLQTFQQYKSGIYNDASCTSAGINHAVIAIGYGNDGAGDYWLIRNSWGTSWGNQGYVQLEKGTNRCGVAAQAAFPTRPASSSTAAPTTTTTTTTARPSTTGTTTAKPTSAPSTTGGSTTGSARSGVVYTDALASGWSVTSSGSVSGITVTAAGQSGYAISASVGANSKLILVSNPTLDVRAFSSLYFSVKTSSYGRVTYDVGGASASTTTSSSFKSVSSTLSSLGGPSGVTQISFVNSGMSTATIVLDNIKFA